MILARNTVEHHYFYRSIFYRITILTPGDRNVLIFSKYFHICPNNFFKQAVMQLPLLVCIYLSSYVWNKSDGWRIIQENL